MSPETIRLVQESFKSVVPIADTAADIFYDRLFETAPHVRSMFPEAMLAQKGKLMQMLGTAVQNLHQLDTIRDAVKDLGARHVGYGVKDEHYQVVGAALLYTLEKGLGDAWTHKLQEAWAEVYTALAHIMIDAAQQKAPEQKTAEQKAAE